MKTYFHTLLMMIMTAFCSLSANAQKMFLSFHILNAPPIPPDSYHAVALSDFGLNRTRYSVLVKIQLPGDTTYYTIPGVLPNGDSFSFRIKTGKWPQSDTLYIVHRGGDRAIQVEDILFTAFHRHDRILSGKPNRRFAKDLLANYYNVNTRQSVPEDAVTPNVLNVPSTGLNPFALAFPHKAKTAVTRRGTVR